MWSFSVWLKRNWNKMCSVRLFQKLPHYLILKILRANQDYPIKVSTFYFYESGKIAIVTFFPDLQ